MIISKRLFSIVIILAIFLIPGESSAYSGYTDVNGDDWYSGHVCKLSRLGIVDGFLDGTFRPAENVSHAQFVKMIAIALDMDTNESVAGHWASPYMEKASETGFGIPENRKIWDMPITRGEASVYISRALEYLDEDVRIGGAVIADLYGYTPREYAIPVLKAYGAGIITGYPDRTFGYDKKITRAESCAVITRLITPIAGREPPTTSNMEVPAWYSYGDDFHIYLNRYEGNGNCVFQSDGILCEGESINSNFNKDITGDISEIMKIFTDNGCGASVRCIRTTDKNIIETACYGMNKTGSDSRYSLFSVKLFDDPTNYSEKKWGYDTMFMKMEINRLADGGLTDMETGKPSIIYEYKIRALARSLFGIEKGDFLAKKILDAYERFSKYGAGEVPERTEIYEIGNIKCIFFTEGGSRRLNFTFTEDYHED